MTTTQTLTDEERDRLRARYLDLDARRREIDDEMSAIKARFRNAYEAGYQATTPDGGKVALSPNRKFDPARAAEVLPAELVRLCTVEKIDPATAKKQLPPSAYEACMVEAGEPRVTVQ